VIPPQKEEVYKKEMAKPVKEGQKHIEVRVIQYV
jgi:hypothetical protein